MNILVLAKQFPYPLHDGASTAIHMLSKGLVNAGANIDLISFNTSKHPYKGSLDIDKLSHYRDIELVALDNQPSKLGGLRNLLSSASYHVSRFYSQAMKSVLGEKLQSHDYDIVQIESAHLLVYVKHIKSYFDGKIVLRAHNVEHVIWQRHSKTLTSSINRWYHQLQAERLRRFEDQMVRQVDQVLAVSAHDTSYFSALNAATSVIPIGIDVQAFVPRVVERKPVFGFIGSMDWLPNHTGLRWLLDEVWSKTSVDTTFIIAGRGSQLYEDSDRRIRVLGEVSNADEFWDQIDVLVVPLFSGSGTRVKIIEALSRSKLVLSTSIGIEGIPAKDGVEALIRDGVPDWLETLAHVHDDWANYGSIREAGFKLASDQFDYKRIGALAHRIYEANDDSLKSSKRIE